ncbi:HD domain-containing protein [Clostridium sp.]|uniref:HD domain-containing protein n=1 Tax=Clostridium sp. TaxID=1506 RepID=UPI003216FDF3
MKPVYLREVINNAKESTISLLLMIKDKEVYKDNIIYTLCDITGEIEFNDKSSSIHNLSVGNVVKACILNNKISKISLEDGAYDLRDFMCYVKRDINDIMEELEEITTNQFQDEEVKALNKYFFEDSNFIEKFTKGIGGLQHHTYIGGLAEHTLNVTHFANEFANRYNCRYKEIAVLAAKLHDIGKIHEYSLNGSFKSTVRGEMEGHIVIGVTMIEEAFNSNSVIYSEDFKNRIKGCIVQHHGKVKYGSPKPPNTEEAFIVHYADYVDATMNKVSKVKDMTKLDCWSEYDKKIETKLFV